MTISAQEVKELRDRTGVGMMNCKKALVECNGDTEKAVDYLRKKGLAAAEKRSGRETAEGRVGHYIHMTGKIGVLVELNCETDFVAKNEEFQQLAKDLCMQVAAANPLAVSREDLPADVIEREKAIYAEQFKDKPARAIEKIVEGKLEKFFSETCLLDQKFVKNDDITIEELVKQTSAKFGENLRVRRFVRFEVGEDT
ncbi:MAG: translation elongation factor Ts [Planctomycetes bacterium]|nr:translation elongation factor Ts [Planctomycetota bacterium]